ncbi:alpha/beta fold hydrolase [Spirillospora sp. CA-294931]|uniref:alpha/beta fold hydrolase n=1 Tax=Spirillospora sp. CA-294931 TaxID=3240042 RepID=UPI003D8E125C
MIPSPRSLRAAASNVASKLLDGHVADLRPTPAEAIGSSVHRYRSLRGVVPAGPPVLLVPSPAAPARCFDLRRGCSLAEHVVNAGRLSYLLDHETPGHAEPGPWVGDVLPEAVRAVSRDTGGQPVQLVGWCLGGIGSLLAAADDPALPVASVAAIAPPQREAVFGKVARPMARRASELVGIDKYLLRPGTMLANLDDREFLAQAEALDHFNDLMPANPGHALRHFYARLPREALSDALDRVRVPVLAIAGRGDGLAPVTAVEPLTRLLENAPEVRFEAVPGGHLGVLTGRTARATTWAHLDRWLDEGTRTHGIRPSRREAAVSL